MHSGPAGAPSLSQTLSLVLEVNAVRTGQGRRRMTIPGLRMHRKRGEGICPGPAEGGFCSYPACPANSHEGFRSAA